jgi:hypothetical protein
MASSHIRERIEAALKRMPQWLRVELASPDRHSQVAAEETLAAMLSAALFSGSLASQPQADTVDSAVPQTPRAA